MRTALCWERDRGRLGQALRSAPIEKPLRGLREEASRAALGKASFSVPSW